MRTRIFLVIDKRGVRRMTTKRRPGLHQNERCITLDLRIPDMVFDTPAMSASIEVPESHVQAPKVVIQTLPVPEAP